MDSINKIYMNRFSDIFTNFVHSSFKVLFGIIFIVSFGMIFVQLISFNISVVVFFIVVIVSLFIGYKVININMGLNKVVLLILVIKFILRVLWQLK
ncbi:hypothetical protein UT300005_07490 [Clostridium sp. CTA-5]